MTGNEISQILFSLLLSHFGAKGHRPRWIAAGVLFSALSCFVLASPHVFYGSGDDALGLTKEYEHLYSDGTREDTTNAPGASIFGNFISKQETLCTCIYFV